MNKYFTCAIILNIFILSNILAQTPNDSVIAYFPFNGNAKDESGNGHNGIVYGATLAPDRFGNANSAYSFDGLDDYIETNIDSAFTNQITISVWIKTDQLFVGYDPGIVAQRNSTNNITGFDLTNENNAVFYIDKIGNGSTNVHSPIQLNDNNWHLLVGTFDGSILKMYIDNVLRSSIVTTSQLAISSNFRIGHDNEPTGPERFFYGYIDDVRFYNYALDSTNVGLLYNESICFQNITVSDTLIINANLTGFNPVSYVNTIKIYPNPSNDHIVVDFGTNYTTMTNYTLTIRNSLSQVVYSTPIVQQQTTVDLNTWTGNGIYFVYLMDEQSNVIDIRKILIQ